MAKKINPIISGGIFPLSPKPPKKTESPLAGKIVPSKNTPVGNTHTSVTPKAGVVTKPKHTGRNVIITAALALVTLAVVKGVNNYRSNHNTDKTVEVVKK